MWGLKQTYFGHLLFSVSLSTKENYGQCGWDAPWRNKDVLGRVRLFYLLKEIEGKHGVCHGQFFHCFNLERKWGEKSSVWWWSQKSHTHSALSKAPFWLSPWNKMREDANSLQSQTLCSLLYAHRTCPITVWKSESFKQETLHFHFPPDCGNYAANPAIWWSIL